MTGGQARPPGRAASRGVRPGPPARPGLAGRHGGRGVRRHRGRLRLQRAARPARPARGVRGRVRRGWPARTSPGGPPRPAPTVIKAIREFLPLAAALDPPPRHPRTSPRQCGREWRLSRPGTVYGRACQLITRQWLPKVPGIPAATIAASARRIPAGPAPSEAAYTREEFEQIKAAAARTFGTALTRDQGQPGASAPLARRRVPAAGAAGAVPADAAPRPPTT